MDGLINLNTEMEYLNKKISNPNQINLADLTEQKQGNGGGEQHRQLTILLRKSLALRVIVTEQYPSQWPLSIQLETFEMPKNLKKNRRDAIENYLNQAKQQIAKVYDLPVPQCCIARLYNELNEMLENDSDLIESFQMLESQTKSSVFLFTDKEKKKSEKKKPAEKNDANNGEEVSVEQNQKFKGSDIIFQRLKWDKSIDKNQIVIGYLDRFKGVLEIKFNDFKGVHEDYREGIPLHRIRYYKIGSEIVWDREKRIDLLTGCNDLNKLFNNDTENKSSTISSVDVSVLLPQTHSEPSKPIKQKELIRASVVEYYVNNRWANYDDSDKVKVLPNFIDNLKLISYNILSSNNFLKSLNNLVKKEQESENSGITIEIAKCFGNIKRMDKIINFFTTVNPDFLFLQECDTYEQSTLKESKFVKENYFICNNDSGCVILSKLPPLWCKQVKLSTDSDKTGLLAKFEFRTDSLSNVESFLVMNLHLTSDHGANCKEKREAQLKTIKRMILDRLYSAQISNEELSAEHILIIGDFNFGDECSEECELIRALFLSNGFVDLSSQFGDVDGITFDPKTNFAAALTSSKQIPRRLDRILLKSKKLEPIELRLENNTPIQFSNKSLLKPILYQPYLNVKTINDKFESLSIDKHESASSVEEEVFLHASDHYALSCTLRVRNSLHESRLTHKSSLAIIVPDHVAVERIQKIREKFDVQYCRWPPHFNLLYPFYNESLSDMQDQDGSVLSSIQSCLSQFEPFDCSLNYDELHTFDKNRVVYIQPCSESSARMQAIYLALVDLFNKNHKAHSSKWRNTLTPHLTIAQPADKQKKETKDWAKSTLNQIKDEFNSSTNNKSSLFKVDAVYLITRENDTTPFKVRHAFPLGLRYPCIEIGLDHDPAQLGLLSFMRHNGCMCDERYINRLDRVRNQILDEISNSLTKIGFSGIKRYKQKEDVFNVIDIETQAPYYNSITTVGSYLHGIKCNDLDFTLARCCPQKPETETDAEAKAELAKNYAQFAENLTYELAQNSDLFRIVRNINDATVPIIEMCLNSEQIIEGADLQIHEIPNDPCFRLDNLNPFQNSYAYMRRLASVINNYNKLYPISGIFENQNLIKYIDNYKDYQVLASFVRYWAQSRCIYGKAFGFVGGISLSIMVIYFLRENKSNSDSPGLNMSSIRFEDLVKKFFNFYAKWNWLQPISLINLNHVIETTKQYQSLMLYKKPMVIMQTVFPYHNTSKNVSEQFRNIICSEIERARLLLEEKQNEENNTTKELLYEKICTKYTLDDLLATSTLYLLFIVEYKSKKDLSHLFTLIKAKTQGLTTMLMLRARLDSVRVYTELFDGNRARDSSKFEHVKYFFIKIGEKNSTTELTNNQQAEINKHTNNFINAIKSMAHTSEFNITLEPKLSSFNY